MVQGSGPILDWTKMPGGHPELERRFEGRIGVLVRQFIYAGALSQAGPNVRELLLEGVPPGQARLGRLLWPITRRLMIAGMNARPGLLPGLERKLEAELDWFEGQLAGRRHLVDGGFGRADVTAASLLAPLAEPAVSALYRNFKTPGSLSAALARWNSRPGFLWVRRVYADHRSAVAPAVAL